MNIIIYGMEIDIFSLVVAIAAVLSLMWNYHNGKRIATREEERLKLSCTYRLGVPELGHKPNNIVLTCSVVNLSSFSVYIDELGFSTSSRGVSEYAIPEGYIGISGKENSTSKFPLKLGSREAVLFRLSNGNQMEEARGRRRIYVKTSSGEIFSEKLPLPEEVFTEGRTFYRMV